VCGAGVFFFVEALPADDAEGEDEDGVGERVGDETERAETTLIRVVETANFEFPPDVVRDDDVSTTAEVQWDVGEEGE